MGEVVDAVRGSLPLTFVVTLAAAVVLGGLIGAARLLLPAEQTFMHAIELNFLSSEKNVYPNETPFSLSDVIAPNILSDVYTANALDKHGIKLNEFRSSISIQPYAPTLADAARRYRDRLADRKLTFAEKAAIEEDMRREMNNLGRQNALLTMINDVYAPIPPPLGRKILRDIAQAWAEDSIERRGVLKLPESMDRSDLVENAFVSGLDYSLAVELVQKAIDRLRDRIERIKGFPGAVGLVDPESGMNVLTLERRLGTLDEFVIQQVGAQIDQFGITRDKQYNSIAIAARIGQLQQEMERAESERKAVQTLRESYRTSVPGEVATLPNGTTRPDRPEGLGGTVIPQLSGDFIDKILSLRDNRSDAEFLQKLAGEELELERKSIGIAHTIARLQKTQKAMDEGGQEGALVENVLKTRIDDAIAKINGFWQVSGRIYDQVNKARFSLAGSLYRDLALPESSRMRHPVERALTLAVFFGLLFIVAAATLVIGVLATLMRQKLERLKN